VEARVIVPAPELSEADLISQFEAAELLGVRYQSVADRLNSGSLSVVWRVSGVAGRGSARLLLRSEVEALSVGAVRGGAVRRSAPEVDGGSAPDLGGCEFGLERRVVRPVPEIDERDVISQVAAREVLAISRSALTRALDRGRFTVVWDLARNGSGSGSARLLLRSEILEAASGRRTMSRDNYRVLPGSSAVSSD
jgi:hypothetical protein